MIVVDANVVLGAPRSRNGASHVVLRGLLTRRFPFALSPAMVLEYEDVLKRPGLLGPTPCARPPS
jgi:predicted nucleic acid-binding protein